MQGTSVLPLLISSRPSVGRLGGYNMAEETVEGYQDSVFLSPTSAVDICRVIKIFMLEPV